MKRVLITGANSYIGESFKTWIKKKCLNEIEVCTIDMIDGKWREFSFKDYDAVFHVAGIAHADVGNVSEERKNFYYKINRDLALETARKAKNEGIKQFIFMSSMIIYSGCKDKIITRRTIPQPLNFYGDSKWQADQMLRKMESDNFRIVILRPPMIYGKGCKGNYSELSRIASKTPVFPIVQNKRSMLYIENLCEFLKLIIINEESGIFFPQNAEYSNTSEVVKIIADVKSHKIVMVSGMNFLISLLKKCPGKIGMLATKAFGDLVYDMNMSEYKENYRTYCLKESIILTEGKSE